MPSVPESQESGCPASLVAVCGAAPLFVHTTVSPTSTVTVDGENAKSTMPTDVSAAGAGRGTAVTTAIDHEARTSPATTGERQGGRAIVSLPGARSGGE